MVRLSDVSPPMGVDPTVIRVEECAELGKGYRVSGDAEARDGPYAVTVRQLDSSAGNFSPEDIGYSVDDTNAGSRIAYLSQAYPDI